jgi:hypothetical protein
LISLPSRVYSQQVFLFCMHRSYSPLRAVASRFTNITTSTWHPLVQWGARIRELWYIIIFFSYLRQKVERELEIKNVKLRDYEELEQACQFLHDNGILLHYDDPSLSGLYFLDPQWLCDMMAHVVAIRDVNPFVQNGKSEFSTNRQIPF